MKIHWKRFFITVTLQTLSFPIQMFRILSRMAVHVGLWKMETIMFWKIMAIMENTTSAMGTIIWLLFVFSKLAGFCLSYDFRNDWLYLSECFEAKSYLQESFSASSEYYRMDGFWQLGYCFCAHQHSKRSKDFCIEIFWISAILLIDLFAAILFACLKLLTFFLLLSFFSIYSWYWPLFDNWFTEFPFVFFS